MKLNTSYELVIMALNSEAKLKARFDFTEHPIQLEVLLLLLFFVQFFKSFVLYWCTFVKTGIDMYFIFNRVWNMAGYS